MVFGCAMLLIVQQNRHAEEYVYQDWEMGSKESIKKSCSFWVV